ncbi:MAG: FeoB small GTPase domain-containing protein, partial [Sphingobacterium sp.]
MNNPIIALLGNPNVGKTSLFNRITKLNQKVGNYPGITVEKREGQVKANNKTYRIIDLPGTYTLFPSSMDEEVVFNTLVNKENSFRPNLVIVVAEPTNLKRSVILYQQARELGLPAIFVINMIDEAKEKGISIDIPKLEQLLNTKVYATNARTGEGIDQLIKNFDAAPPMYISKFQLPTIANEALEETKRLFPLETEYHTWQYLAKGEVSFLSKEKNDSIQQIRDKHQLKAEKLQKEEAILRSKSLDGSLAEIYSKDDASNKNKTNAIDKILLHPIFGYLIFFGILFLIFQAIYTWSGPAMDFIDGLFGDLAAYTQATLPAGPLTDLLSNGIIKGIGGIVIFIPQI